MITTVAVEPEFGTVEWISYKVRRAESDLYDVALFLWRESVSHNISFKKIVEQYRQLGAEITCSDRTLSRRLEALPEYQQHQEHKRLNPSAGAMRKRKHDEKKRYSCHDVKSNAEANDDTLSVEVEAVEVVEPPLLVGAWEDDLLWYGEVEKRGVLPKEDLSKDVAIEFIWMTFKLTAPGVLFIDRDEKLQCTAKLSNQLIKEAEEKGITYDKAAGNYVYNHYLKNRGEVFKEKSVLSTEREEKIIDKYAQMITRLTKKVAFLKTALIAPQYLSDEEIADLEKMAKEWLEKNEIDPDESPFLDYARERLREEVCDEYGFNNENEELLQMSPEVALINLAGGRENLAYFAQHWLQTYITDKYGVEAGSIVFRIGFGGSIYAYVEYCKTKRSQKTTEAWISNRGLWGEDADWDDYYDSHLDENGEFIDEELHSVEKSQPPIEQPPGGYCPEGGL